MEKTCNEGIRTLRNLHNYSQSYVAQKLNMTQPAYQKLENGKTDCALGHLEKLSKLYKIPVKKIVEFTPLNIFNKIIYEGGGKDD